jgi:U3 small nucleolar RNA-associated protein 10
LPRAKIALLKTLENISDEVKAQALMRVMQDLVQNSLVDQFGASLEEYATLVVSSFDKSSSGALNEESSSSWPIFVSVLRHFFPSGTPISAYP